MTKTDLVNFESKIAELFKQGKIRCPIHLSSGNEEQLIQLFKDIAPWDYVFSTHRNHYHYLLHTDDAQGLMEKILSGDSMHTCDPKWHFYSSSIVAGCVSIACGVALALKMKDSIKKVWCFIGDGAADEGWFTEALKYAVTMDLPIVYVLEDNNRSVESSTKQRWGVDYRYTNDSRFRSKLLVYEYNCGYPHTGDGEWVTF